MKRYVGKIYWYEGFYKEEILSTYECVSVNRAILENNTFRISYASNDNETNALISLKSEDGFTFAGSVKGIDEEVYSGKINLEFYQNKTKSILIGKWIDEGEIDTCIIELKEVIEFKK